MELPEVVPLWLLCGDGFHRGRVAACGILFRALGVRGTQSENEKSDNMELAIV